MVLTDTQKQLIIAGLITKFGQVARAPWSLLMQCIFLSPDEQTALFKEVLASADTATAALLTTVDDEAKARKDALTATAADIAAALVAVDMASEPAAIQPVVVAAR